MEINKTGRYSWQGIQETGRYRIQGDTRYSEIQGKKDSDIWRCGKQEYS
jgi:hypothetical protein